MHDDGPPLQKSEIVPSRMALLQHPLHPMLVSYPVAFLTSVVLTDLLFVLFPVEFWAQASLALNVAGLLGGVAAALVGLADFLLLREVRRHVSAWNHLIAGVMVIALAAGGVMLRWPEPSAAVVPWGLVLSGTTAVMVAAAGWLGGTLTFKYGVGVYGREERAGKHAADAAADGQVGSAATDDGGGG